MQSEVHDMTDLTTTMPKTAADYKTVINQLLDEMLRLEVQMQYDRVEIERLRAESQVITRHTDLLLDRLGKQLEALGSAA
jgi:hypothetical protein